MAQLIGFTAGTQIFDPGTGTFTGEGFRLIQFIVEAVNGAGGVVTLDGVQTLTNKTIDGDSNTLLDIATAALKTKTGVIGRVVTGTAGSAGKLAAWNADGDLVDGSLVIANVLTTADIGVTVQPFDATILTAADIGVSVQPYNASALDGSDIGVLVQAYDPELTVWAAKTAPAGTVVGTTDAQTLTGKTLTTPTLTLKQSGSPTPTAEGDIQWDTDDDILTIGDGVGQKYIYPTTSGTTTPTVTATSGTFTSVSCTLHWRRAGPLVHVEAFVIITTNGTAAGAILVPLPFTALVSGHGSGREGAVTGNMVQVHTSGANAVILTPTNGYPGASGYTIGFGMTYIV